MGTNIIKKRSKEEKIASFVKIDLNVWDKPKENTKKYNRNKPLHESSDKEGLYKTKLL